MHVQTPSSFYCEETLVTFVFLSEKAPTNKEYDKVLTRACSCHKNSLETEEGVCYGPLVCSHGGRDIQGGQHISQNPIKVEHLY